AASKSADLADRASARSASANPSSKQSTPPASKPAADKPADKTTAEKTADADKPIDPFAEAPTPISPAVTTGGAAAADPLTQANVNVSDAGLVEIHVNDANLGEVL